VFYLLLTLFKYVSKDLILYSGTIQVTVQKPKFLLGRYLITFLLLFD